VANENGEMLMALRYPVPAIRHIAPGAEFTTETWQYKRPLGAELDVQQRFATQRIESFRSSYNPTRRGWFQQAQKMQGPIWTSPYVFVAAQELGVDLRAAERAALCRGKPQGAGGGGRRVAGGACRSSSGSSAATAMARAPS
jgi:adenylate cyclase